MNISIRKINNKKYLIFNTKELKVALKDSWDWDEDYPVTSDLIRNVVETGSPETHTREVGERLEPSERKHSKSWFEKMLDELKNKGQELNEENIKKAIIIKKTVGGDSDSLFQKAINENFVTFSPKASSQSGEMTQVTEPYSWIIWRKPSLNSIQKKILKKGERQGDEYTYETSKNLQEKLKNFINAELDTSDNTYGVEMIVFVRGDNVPKNLETGSHWIGFERDWLKERYGVFDELNGLSPVGTDFVIKNSENEVIEAISGQENTNTENTDNNGTGNNAEEPEGSRENTNQNQSNQQAKEPESFRQELLNDLNEYAFIGDLFAEFGVNREKFANLITEKDAKNLYKLNKNKTEYSFDTRKFKEWVKQNKENLTDAQKPKQKPDSFAYRTQASSAIKLALNQEPKITNQDLDSKWNNWENKLADLADKKVIFDFQRELVAHIKQIRDNKQSEKNLEENLNKANSANATINDKKEALKNISQQEGSEVNEKNKDKIKKLEKEVAQDNPTDYRNLVITELSSNLTKYELTETELDEETKKEIQNLKNGQITEPEKLVEMKMKINEKIGRKGVEKKIVSLTKKIKEVLKLGNEEEKERLKIEIMKFINSNNIYYKFKKDQFQNLLNQLELAEGLHNQKKTLSPSSSSWKIVLPISLLLVLVIAVIVIIAKKKKKGMKTK
ncbi:MAG: hypothetical protein I3274_07625 [Candidatus Moeniiplasma glomeromycotorum]|nr:hypothetical protein [Candidatus Moeniiplasma glomeromycotorum]